ncbi:N-6 DNA methylase [Frankia sp. CNm7]|uniref:N-6 DNA methylase n=1 Tax=Frankia nepalensis TaxID=1836974 RepID=A0A937RGT2_9ACTN|nr:type I restriction-modification system subunit M/S [Frankia nepalensis]MBL7496134.1 N-6 DNA methylase [Frankia nepalensis]MBL7508927.1 N-6 DNA methylase [Frankia nepalensis]MBL7516767.1 N-6 DNA methylase [Frankia nepalensis]MBL7628705.1 N-6 DNA methylase [Frankia nepalensis]
MRSDSTAPPDRGREWSAGTDPLVTRREISDWAGVSRETVTIWQGRHADFPRPVADGAMERFRLSEMLVWLADRPVPKAQRRAGEPDGITYADRMRRATRLSANAGPRQQADHAAAEETLTEIFGPLGRRIRGGGSEAAYLHFVVGLLFLRHRDPASWAGLRDDVRIATDEQSDPRQLMRRLGRRVNVGRRAQGLPSAPEATADTFSALGGPAVEDVGQLIRLCEDLPPETFRDLLGRYDLWARPDGRSSTTPRSLVDLMTALFVEPDSNVHLHDPYGRAGELLVGARLAGGSGPLSAAGPDPDMCRLAEMGVNLHGGQVHLTLGSETPWLGAPGPFADLILTNPPFNASSARRPDERWLFGPPPPGNDNYAWLQHVLASLKPGGLAAMLMPNRAAASDDPREQFIRQRMIETGAVEFVVALPRRLFATTRVAVMLWGLRAPGTARDDVLFVEVRGPGPIVDNQRRLAAAEIDAVTACLRLWQTQAGGTADLAEVMSKVGAARAVPTAQIARLGYSLDPAEYLAPATSLDCLVRVPSCPATALADQMHAAHTADEKAAGIVLRSGDTAISGDAAADDLPDGWSRAVLGDLCAIQAGPSNQVIKKIRSSAADGIPVVLPRDLQDRRIRTDSPQMVARVDATEMTRFALREDDILFVRTGTVGPVARVRAAEADWLLGTNLMRLRAHEGVNPGYLLALLSSRPAQEWITRRAESATAIPSISTKTLGSLPVLLPPLAEQRRIGAVLSDLDDQIAAHRALADAAEGLRAEVADQLVAGLLITETLSEEPR